MDCLVCGDTGFAFGAFCTCKVATARKEEYARLLQEAADFSGGEQSYESFGKEEDMSDPCDYSNAGYLQLLLESCEWMHFASKEEGEDRLSSLPWAYVGRNATHYFWVYIEPDDSIILKTSCQGIDVCVPGSDIPVMTEDVSIQRIEDGRHLSQVYIGHS